MKIIKNVFLMFMSLTLITIPMSIPNGGIVNVSNSYNVSYNKGESVTGSLINQINQKRTMDPVVMLTYIDSEGDNISTATGFSVKYDNKTGKSYVLTNHHFCDVDEIFEKDGFFVYSRSNEVVDSKESPIKLILNRLVIEKTDPFKDLCLLSTDGRIRPVILEEKNYLPKIMDRVYTVGAPRAIFPIGLEMYFTGFIDREVISEEMKDGEPFYLLSGMILKGQSGSPIFNSNGKVIGVVFMGWTGSYGGGAIPISDIYLFLEI